MSSNNNGQIISTQTPDQKKIVRSSICPKGIFGQHPRLEPRSKKSWFGKEPGSQLGWSDKSMACLGLHPDTSIIWSPVYLDSIYDNRALHGFAKKNGLPTDELCSLIVREWFYNHRDDIVKESEDFMMKEMTEDDLEKKIKSMESSMKRLEELREKMKNSQK